MNSVPQGGMCLFSISISDNGIFRDEGGLGSVGGSVDISSKVVVKENCFRGNREESGG
jgi:hypothetical protein